MLDEREWQAAEDAAMAKLVDALLRIVDLPVSHATEAMKIAADALAEWDRL